MNFTAIAIIAIIFFGIAEIIKQAKKKAPNSASQSTQDAMQQQLDTLKERVATLEKIVTDESYDLKKQFDSLKD